VTKFLALLSGLAALSRIAGLLKWLPGIGPFAAITSAVLAFLAAVARMFFQGLTVIVSQPVTLVTVGILMMGSVAGGVKLGVEWTEHRVARFDAFKAELRKTDAQSKQDATDAIAARKQAEAKAEEADRRAVEAAIAADAIARAAAAGRLRANRVRAGAPGRQKEL